MRLVQLYPFFSFELHLFQLKSGWGFQHRSFWAPQPGITPQP